VAGKLTYTNQRAIMKNLFVGLGEKNVNRNCKMCERNRKECERNRKECEGCSYKSESIFRKGPNLNKQRLMEFLLLPSTHRASVLGEEEKYNE